LSGASRLVRGALVVGLVIVGSALGACSDNPVYLSSNPPTLDFVPTNDPDAGAAMLDLAVPMALPTADDDQARADIATRLGVTVDEVPSLRRDDTDLELEWTLENAGDTEVTAFLGVNGANEFYRYDSALIITPNMDDEEEPPPPALGGGKPIYVPAASKISGVIREDELSEAAQDLDAMSRGGYNYTKALITRWPSKDISGGMGGLMDFIPSEIVPLLLDITVTVSSSSPLRLTANLRVRDRSGRLRATETDAAMLVPASTTLFQPPMMMPEAKK
jgi:hypothetical protein